MLYRPPSSFPPVLSRLVYADKLHVEEERLVDELLVLQHLEDLYTESGLVLGCIEANFCK